MADAHPLTLAWARDYPGELASWLAVRGTDAVAQTLDGLPAEVAAGLVARLPHAHAVRVLAEQADEQVSRWLDAAETDQALSLLLHLDEARRTRVLATLSSRRKRRTLTRLVVYPVGTVGALVDSVVPGLDAAMPLTEAVAILRENVPAPDRPIWLVDEAGAYMGMLDLNGALVARSEAVSLKAFLIPVKALRAELTLADARHDSAWLTHAELPVIDYLGHLLGTLSRTRLEAALADGNVTDQTLADSTGELTRQYFRVMGALLHDLLGPGGQKR